MWILLIIFLLFLSIYLSIKLKFKNYKLNILKLLSKDKTSLFLTLGTKIGVGSLIGTTSSIIIGGFSSVIWMILFSILTTSITYHEAYYGNKYKKENNNNFVGGPYYILKYGLNKKILSIVSLILLIAIYSFLFQMIQMNSIGYLLELLNIKKTLIIIISLIVLFITFRLSIEEVLNGLNKIVPLMCLLFIIVSIYGIINNFRLIDITLITKDFISIKSILTGLVIGVKRSIFMNELLIGTTSTGSASDKNDTETSINYQILSVYFIGVFITIIISLLLLIYLSTNDILSNYNLLLTGVYSSILGKYGLLFLLIIYILFGFTTILSGYYIGKNNIEYLTNSKIILTIFKIVFIVFAVSGIIFKSDFLWNIIDNLILIMIIINSYSIIKLIKYEKEKI
ncbi:MAG: alanine:cation symporter family protein [Bacilli bacterium]